MVLILNYFIAMFMFEFSILSLTTELVELFMSTHKITSPKYGKLRIHKKHYASDIYNYFKFHLQTFVRDSL